MGRGRRKWRERMGRGRVRGEGGERWGGGGGEG